MADLLIIVLIVLILDAFGEVVEHHLFGGLREQTAVGHLAARDRHACRHEPGIELNLVVPSGGVLPEVVIARSAATLELDNQTTIS